MRTATFITILCLLFLVDSTVLANTKKKKENIKLVEAYTQRTVAGIPGAPPTTGQHFIIIWQGASYPETFFWRGQAGWLNCNMQKAHKLSAKAKETFNGVEYSTEYLTGDQIHAGDTLQLSPVTGGRFPIPAEIPKGAKNTLFYKTSGSKWLSFPIKKLSTKRDITLQ